MSKNKLNEKSPLGKNWSVAYIFVILALIAQIVFFWFFTNTYS